MTRSFKILVVSSVLLNVLLLGIVMGQFASGARLSVISAPGDAAAGGMRREALSALSPEYREEFRALVDSQRDKIRDFDTDLKVAREEVARAMEADPFDPQAYARAVEDLHVIQALLRMEMADSVGKMAQDWPVSERAALAQSFLKREMGGGGAFGGHGPRIPFRHGNAGAIPPGAPSEQP